MANEIRATYDSGETLYVQIFNAAGQVRDVVAGAWDAFAVADWADYDTALSEIATNSGQYRGTFPALAAGVYSVLLYLQAGGAPASTDTRLGETATMYWDGSAEITNNMMDTVLDTAAADVVNVDGIIPNSVVPDAAGVAATPAEVATALTDIGLDHLISAAVADEVVNDSIIAKLVSKDATADWSDYSWQTESLEALKDGVLDTIAVDVAGVNGITPEAAGVAPTANEIRDAILDDATRFSGADIAIIAADVVNIDGIVPEAAGVVPTAAEVRDAILDDATRFSGASIAAILADVTGLNGDVMRGTDGVSLVVPDASGTAATLHGITDGKVDAVQSTVDTIEGYTDLIDDVTDGLAAIKAEVEGLAGEAMRGTDSAALASVCTEVRLAELAAANMPAEVDAIKAYVDTVEVTLTAITGYVDQLEGYTDTLEASATTIAGYVDTVEATLALIKVKTDLLTTGQVEVSAPVTDDEEVIIVRGDSYLDADSRALTWTSESWSAPSLTSATGKLRFISKSDYDVGDNTAELEVDVTVSMDGSDAVFKADLTPANTADLTASPPEDRYNYIYQLIVTTTGGSILTVALGSVWVKEDLTV